MCGIGGWISFDPARRPDAQPMIHSFVRDLDHRGPDGHGSWHDDRAVLAHTRLAIIDLEASAQPMTDGAGRVLAYNGEVFNYKELRSRRGNTSSWRTGGDVEVFMRILGEDGPAGLRAVRGQFGAALWDPANSRLTLVRDEMGVLPLFWWSDGANVAFASDIDALRAVLPRQPRIDPESLALYLRYRATPAPLTLWEGIRKVRPGHAVVFEHGRPPVESEWVAPPPAVDHTITPEAAVKRAGELFDQAVERALEADVPVGMYLSGGLDSSMVSALAARHRPGEVLRTYCAIFADSPASEGDFAATVAAHLGTEHTEVPIVSADFVDEWPRLSRLRGAPISEPSDMAMHHLARRAREDVKVVLSGEGADELFAGYPKHRFGTPMRIAGRMPWPALAGARVAADRLPPRARRVAVAMRAMAQPDEDERIRAWFSSFTPPQVRELTRLGPMPAVPVPAPGEHPLVRMLRFDQQGYLSDNLLERGDRMSMAASLELRPPLLDSDVVAFARSLPPEVLLHRRTGKYVVKQVARALLPATIIDRRKAGFPVPLSRWLREGMREYAHDLLGDPDGFVRGHLDPEPVARLLSRHDSGASDEAIRIWTLLSLEVWGRAATASAPASQLEKEPIR